MPAYIIAMVNVSNPDAYKEYAALAGPATAKYGGTFLARGGKTDVLEGNLNFGRVVINMFGRPVPTELSFHQVEKLT